VLDEVDSYVSLGFVDDAKDLLREVEARFPAHPAILEKTAELGIELLPVAAPEAIEAPESAPEAEAALLEAETPKAPAAEPPSLEAPVLSEPVLEEPPPMAAEGPSLEEALGALSLPETPAADVEPPAAAASEGGLDLGAELGELFGAQSAVEEVADEEASTQIGDAGLADIFREFKKGVDKQLGKEDYDTRYNLGIAYKEMGLVDEAIAEFQLAAKDESRLLECSSMLGICFMEKGMPKLAVKWFEKGLKAPGRTEEEYNGLRYDLAMAYEASGETDRALGLYTDLYGQDANFRDVAAKVRELKGA
jgi:tetratricopeptide (TPR) repeat protein